MSDAPDRVWVLDSGSGELTLCQQYAAAGPKVIDVVRGGGRCARPRAQPGAVLRGGAERRANARRNAAAELHRLLDVRAAGRDLERLLAERVLPGGGYLSGGFPVQFRALGRLLGRGDVVVVRPKIVNIDVN